MNKKQRDCLDRLKLRSPALSLEYEARWTYVRDHYLKEFKGTYGLKSDKETGAVLLGEVRRVLEALGPHYEGDTPWSKKKAWPSAKAASSSTTPASSSKAPAVSGKSKAPSSAPSVPPDATAFTKFYERMARACPPFALRVEI